MKGCIKVVDFEMGLKDRQHLTDGNEGRGIYATK